jgi:hypothetical protein
MDPNPDPKTPGNGSRILENDTDPYGSESATLLFWTHFITMPYRHLHQTLDFLILNITYFKQTKRPPLRRAIFQIFLHKAELRIKHSKNIKNAF